MREWRRLLDHEFLGTSRKVRELAAGVPQRVSYRAAILFSVFLVAWGNGVVLVQRRIGGDPGEVFTLVSHPVLGLFAVAYLSFRGWKSSSLGVSRPDLAPGGRWGMALALVVGILAALGFTGGGTCPNGAGMPLSTARLLVGTALGEELLHRGVMTAVWSGTRSSPLALFVANAMTFGAWHIAGAWTKPWPWRVLELAAPALLGAPMFLWVRLRTGRLIVPVLLHAAVNLPGFLISCGR